MVHSKAYSLLRLIPAQGALVGAIGRYYGEPGLNEDRLEIIAKWVSELAEITSSLHYHYEDEDRPKKAFRG